MTAIEQPLRLLRLHPAPYNFFADLFENFMGGGTVIYTADEPDIIEVPILAFDNLLRVSLADARREYGFKPLTVAVGNENVSLAAAGLDYALSTFAPTAGAHLHYNWNLNQGFGRALMEPDGADAEKLRAYRVKSKSKFCNYVFSNDGFPATRVRREFCRLLSRYKRVDCAGKSLNNTDALFKLDKRYGGGWTSKLEFSSDYKFTIAFENAAADGWLTEKPMIPLAVGSIPIYWGDPQIGQCINPRSFINAADYDSFDALVEHVKLVDNDPDLYAEYRNAPPLLPSSRFYDMRRDLPPFLERIAAEALRRRETDARDGFLNWRRYYQVGKMIYANRERDPGYKRRIATLALSPGAKRLIKKAAPRRLRLK